MLRLEGGDTCLIIDDRDPPRCQCWLLRNNKSEVFLGEADFHSIRNNLLSALQGTEQKPLGEIDGITVTWGSAFSPLRYALYFGRQNANTIIFVQDDRQIVDDQPGVIARLILGPDHVTQWLTLLGA